MTEVDYVLPTDYVVVTKGNRVATIELNRPESLNAFNKQLLKSLIKALKQISMDDSVDIVVLKGAGNAFSSGGDIKVMIESTDEQEFFGLMDYIHDLAVTLYCLPKLTICAIHGAAAGLGLSVALAADYIIADRDAKIAMNFIGIGLIPDCGGHFFLSQRVGDAKAKEIIWGGKVMSAPEAKQNHLINEVAEYSLDDAVNVKISTWLQSPTKAMIRTKKILAEGNRPFLIKMLELEKHGQLKIRKTKDHREGIQAFIEKRKPNFIGK